MDTLPTNPLQRAERRAAAQEGAISLRQALDAGLSDDQVERLATQGRWLRKVHGVYAVAGAPDTPRQRLLVAYLATSRAGGVVSHLSAAAEWGLGAPPFLPFVSVPPLASHACRGATVVRTDVPPVDRAHRRGIVVTSVSRTLVDVAALLDRPALAGVVDDALCRKLASASSVEAALGRIGRGRRGKALMRSVLEAWTPAIVPDSPAEVRLLRLAAELGIVGLVPQYEVRDERGEFIARLDLARPDHRQGLEYDGIAHHGPRAWGRDEARYERLRALGWDVQCITKLDLCPGEPRLREIASAWAAASAA